MHPLRSRSILSLLPEAPALINIESRIWSADGKPSGNILCKIAVWVLSKVLLLTYCIVFAFFVAISLNGVFSRLCRGMALRSSPADLICTCLLKPFLAQAFIPEKADAGMRMYLAARTCPQPQHLLPSLQHPLQQPRALPRNAPWQASLA